MKTPKEIAKWLKENCRDEYGRINLSGLPLKGERVILDNMNAECIFQRNHKAEEIFQYGHKAEDIYQYGHEANKVEEGWHTKPKKKMTIEKIQKELGYEIELKE